MTIKIEIMKLIYRIAKAELRMLFCSPVAWFLLVIFTLQTALFFTGRYEWFMKGNEYGNGRTMMTSMALFANGIWGIVQNYLYYYIPLLTMGLISRELSSGSTTQDLPHPYFSVLLFSL